MRIRWRTQKNIKNRNAAMHVLLVGSVIFTPLAADAKISNNLTPNQIVPNQVVTERVSCIEKKSFKERSGTVTVLESNARITAYHVVKDCMTIYIGNRRVKVTYADPVNDVAILGKEKDFQQLNCRSVTSGEKLTVSGFPFGSKQSLTSHGVRLQSVGEKYGAMSGIVVDGMSGGPVLNNAGDLVGVAKARSGLSKLHFVTGPSLCASLANYKGAILRQYS